MEGWNWKHIYAMLANDGKIKIGISKYVPDRVKEIENQKEIEITDYFFTEKCSNPYMVERMIHEELKDFRHSGEWFTVTFEHAVRTIDKIFKKYAKFDKSENNKETAKQMLSLFENKENTNENINTFLLGIIEWQNKIIIKNDEKINALLNTIEKMSNSINELKKYVIGDD